MRVVDSYEEYMYDLHHWLLHLESLHPKSIEMGLSRILPIADSLELRFPNSFVVTVTGTNGKGSCVALLDITLRNAGYKVGTYTSPHLLRYNERIKINGLEIDDLALCNVFAEIESARGNISLTQFEFGTLAALLLFKHAQLDVVILEVGLGGRLDAVNIVDPDLAIITTIALDHMEWLGTTREAIGYEKAGIMRSGKPVICGDFDTPLSVKNHAEKIKAILLCMTKDFGYETFQEHWRWWSHNQFLENLPIPKIALQNAATALQAIESMSSKFLIQHTTIIAALQQVFLAGRFQIVDGPKQRIYDVAHNPAAAELLAEQLKNCSSKGRTFAVLAMLSDKDQLGTAMPLLPLIDSWYVAGLEVPRGGTAKILSNNLQSLGATNVFEHTNVEIAYRMALADAKDDDRIIVFGSFYTVAKAMQLRL